jgi:tetratricopeptide (TPR) repeat protein
MKRTVILFLLWVPVVLADNQKAEKKALELQAKTFVKEAKDLEKAGRLLDARARYANSQSFTDSKEAAEAIKRIDGEIRKRAKDTLRTAHQLYDQGKFKPAADALEEAAKLTGSKSIFSYNLALCYRRLGDMPSALGHLDQAAMGTADPKRKLKIKQLRTALVTGEQVSAAKNDERDRINKINQMIEDIGFEASVDEGQPSLQPKTETATSIAYRSNVPPVTAGGHKAAARTANLCQVLTALNGPAAQSAAVVFDLANCAEDNDRLVDAARLLSRYLEIVPDAADADRVRLRIARLGEMAALPGQKGVLVRSLSASASRALEARRYEVALENFQKAAAAAPEFAPTEWKLALMYEAMGNVEKARVHFGLYRQLESNPTSQQEADLHLNTLEVKRSKYDEEVDAASEILSDLFNRAMNLTFNGLEDRASQYKQRAKERARQAAKHKVRVVGGFTVPFAYAQQQLAEAGDHLASALVLFPLGAEANQLMGLVLLQANDGRSSMRSFDVVAAQSLPVAFYAEMRGRHQDHAVKCELTRDGLRLIYLSSYDKNAKPTAPAKQAGEDGLGDLVIDASAERRQDFESLTIRADEIKSIGTKNGHLQLKLAKEELTLAPIYLPAFPPADGPAGRRFGNNYTRLFVRYPGLEESKLGAEGLTGYEKVKLGYDMANAALNITTSLNPIGAIGALQSFVQITREVQGVAKSLHVTFAGWLRTIEDQQELQSGNTFKLIPTESAALSFVEEIK